MMATRMFWELRTVRKLTEPSVVNGTATTKKSTIRPRKTQAQMRLKNTASALRRRQNAGGRWRVAERRPRGAIDHRFPRRLEFAERKPRGRRLTAPLGHVAATCPEPGR